MTHARTYLWVSVSCRKHFAGEACGRSEAGEPVAPHSAQLMEFSGQLRVGAVEVDSMPPQATYSLSTDYSV